MNYSSFAGFSSEIHAKPSIFAEYPKNEENAPVTPKKVQKRVKKECFHPKT